MYRQHVSLFGKVTLLICIGLSSAVISEEMFESRLIRGTPCEPVAGRVAPDLGSGVCSGNFQAVIEIPNVGSFIHNSNAGKTQRGYGLGFDFNEERRVFRDASNTYVLQEGDGTRIPLILNGLSGGGIGSGSGVGSGFVSAASASTILLRARDIRQNKSLFGISSSGVVEKSPDGLIYYYQRVGNMRSVNFAISVIRDRNGNDVRFQRDAQGKILSVSNKLGVRRFNYDSRGLLTSVTDTAGNAYGFSMENQSGSDFLTSVKRPDSGHLWQVQYDFSKGKISKVLYPNGSSEKAGYDEKGNVVYIINQNNYLTQYRYTDTSVSSENSQDKYQERFEKGLLASVSESSGETQFVRDALGRAIKVNLPNKMVIDYTYQCGSACGQNDPKLYNIAKVTRTNGSVVKSESYTYQCNTPDNVCDLISYIDEGGIETKSTFTSREPYHLVVSRTSNGRTTKYVYDGAGNPTEIQTPFGAEKRIYNSDGTIQSRVNILGLKTTYQYNSKGLLASSTDHFGRVTQYGYDGLGRKNSVVTPVTSWSGEFDVAGRAIGSETKTQGTLTSQKTKQASYDPATGKILQKSLEIKVGEAVYSKSQSFDPRRGFATPSGVTISTPTSGNLSIRNEQNKLVPQAGPVPAE